MNYKLICADIDGTLLNSEKRLLPQVKRSLQEAAAAGIQIALVSGRMPSGVDFVEMQLGLDCIKVCNAGTYILMGDRCIGAEYLPNRIMKEIYRKIAVKNGIPLWIFRNREWFVSGMDDFIEKEIGFVAYEPELVDVEKFAESWEMEKKRPNKLLLAASPDKIQEFYHEIKCWELPEIDMACSADTFLEIFPRGVSKGKALEKICGELGIGLEHTIAFGDHELDIPLIEEAGMGVAMGNAIEALKEKADFVTKTNDEAGIAFALELLLKE